MKILNIKKGFILLVILLYSGIILGQTNPYEVFDRFGNIYSSDEIAIPANKSSVNAGVFDLYFETDLLTQAQKDVIQQVYTDLSYLIRPGATLPGGATGGVAIQILDPSSNMPDYALAGGTPFFWELGSGITSGSVWKYINTGVDPLLNLNLGVNYHGYMMVRSTPLDGNSWYVSSTEEDVNYNEYDFYSVILHEALHILGFYSTILDDGRSVLSSWSPSGEPGLYSMFDMHLFKYNGSGYDKVINTGTDCYETFFNSMELEGQCGNLRFVFDHSNEADNEIIYSDYDYYDGSSYSHFLCSGDANYDNYLMTAESSLGITCRHPHLQEVRALNSIGYEISWTYGYQAPTLYNYTNPGDDSYVIAGANDFISTSIELGESIDIPIADIIANDYSTEAITGITCLEIVIAGYDDELSYNNLTASSGVLTFQSGTMFTGSVYLKYFPINYNNQPGNISYIKIYVSPAPLPECSINNCNYICNGNFEQITTSQLYYLTNILPNQYTDNSIDFLKINSDLSVIGKTFDWSNNDCHEGYVEENPHCDKPPLYYEGNIYPGNCIGKSSMESFFFELNKELDKTKNYILKFKAYSDYFDTDEIRFYISSTKPCTFCDLTNWNEINNCTGGWDFYPHLLNNTVFVPGKTNREWDEYSIQITSDELQNITGNIKYLIIPSLPYSQASKLYFDDFVLEEEAIASVNIEAIASNYSPCEGDEYNITYTFSIPNEDPIPTEDIIFDYYKPANVEVINSGNFSVSDNIYSHTFNFNGQQTYTFDAVLRVNSAIPGQPIENIGQIFSTNVCSNYTNSNSVTITPLTPESLTLNIVSDYTEGGGEIIFNVTVTNNIDKIFNNIELFSALTSDIDFSGSQTFQEIGTNQIQYTIPELPAFDTKTYTFTVSIEDISYHENQTCISVASGACDISDCVSTFINEPVSEFSFTVEDGIYCEGRLIGYYLSSSEANIEYRLFKNFDTLTNEGNLITSTIGDGGPITWSYYNIPGEYRVYASYGTSQQTLMPSPRTVEAYPLPLACDVAGDEVCQGEQATVIIYQIENGVEYNLPGFITDYTYEDIDGNRIYTINTTNITPDEYQLDITASNGNCDIVLSTGLAITPLPETNFTVDAPEYVSADEETVIYLNNINPNYNYDIYINGVLYTGNQTIQNNTIILNFEQGYFGAGNYTFTFEVSNENCVAEAEQIIEFCSIEGEFLNYAQPITEPEFLSNTTYIVNNDIVVEDRGILDISNCNFVFKQGVKLVVEPGGKLIINNSHLTSDNQCDFNTWQGIVVNSDIKSDGIGEFGILEIYNSTIEYAEIGVFTTNGGSVKAENSHFKDNFTDIKVERYYDASGYNLNLFNNTFETTNDFYALDNSGLSYPCHINITVSNYNKSVVLKGNDIINSSSETDNTKKGQGIVCVNSSLKVTPFCSNYEILPCPEDDLVPNTFTNLYKAIDIQNDGQDIAVTIDGNEFLNNQTGIYVSACSPVVTRNYFRILPNTDAQVGMFMANCTGYQVEENKFVSKEAKNNVGLVVRNSGSDANEIYKNEFTNLYVACEAQGVNTDPYSLAGPGLEFLCNIFTDNKYNIYLAEKVPTNDIIVTYSAYEITPPKHISYGIAPSQGSSKLSTGNEFYGISDYHIANYQSPITYYYDRRAETNPYLVSGNVSRFESNINKCPSQLNTYPNWSEMNSYEDSISTTKNYLENTIDAGNTDDVLYEIESTYPNEVIKLYYNLMSLSPNLSDTSMVSSTLSENVLPPVMLTNILSANQRAPKSAKVLYALENRENQLPPPFMNDILAGRDSLSHHEVVASNLGGFISQRSKTINQIARNLRSDSLTQQKTDSLVMLYQQANNLASDYRLISVYMYLNEYDNAQNVLLQIPDRYELSPIEQKEYNEMSQIIDVQTDLFSNDLTYSDINDAQKSVLYTLSEDSISRAAEIARNIISMVDSVDYSYGVVIPIIDTTDNKDGADQPKLAFNVSPNPAYDYFVVDYQLPVKDFKNAEFVMFNKNNKGVYSQKLTKYWYQLLIETGRFEPGFYMCKLLLEGKKLDSKGIIIKPDEMTPYAAQVAEKLYFETINGQNKVMIVYPNPADDFVNVKLNINSEATITINDNSGKQVLKQNVKNDSPEIKLNTSNLSGGVYTINLIIDEEIISSETIIKR